MDGILFYLIGPLVAFWFARKIINRLPNGAWAILEAVLTGGIYGAAILGAGNLGHQMPSIGVVEGVLYFMAIWGAWYLLWLRNYI